MAIGIAPTVVESSSKKALDVNHSLELTRSPIQLFYFQKSQNDNPLRYSSTQTVPSIESQPLLVIPNAVLDIKPPALKRTLRSDLQIPFHLEGVSDEVLESIRTSTVSIASEMDLEQSDYIKATIRYYQEHNVEIAPYIDQLIDYQVGRKKQGNHTVSDTAFLVHVGTPQQALRFAPEIAPNFDSNNVTHIKELFHVLGQTPTFIMKREEIVFKGGHRPITCEVVCAPLIPSFAIDDQSKYSDSARRAVIEGNQFAAFIRNADVIAQGGMSAQATVGGVCAQISLDVIKAGLLHKVIEGSITIDEVLDLFPNVFTSRVTTGHVGTILGMNETRHKYVKTHLKLDEKVHEAIIGAGGFIGGAHAELLARTPEILGRVFLVDIDKGISRANKVRARLIDLGVPADKLQVLTTQDYINNGLASMTNILTIATSATEPLEQLYPNFTSHVLDIIGKDLQDNITSMQAMVMADNHPSPFAEDTMDWFMESKSRLYTEVGLVLQATSTLKSGSSYNLDKPEGRHNLVRYGCQAEGLAVALLGIGGFLGKANIDKVSFLQNELEKAGIKPKVRFHGNRRIVKDRKRSIRN